MTTVWSIIQARIEASLGERKGIEKAPGMLERVFGMGPRTSRGEPITGGH